MLRDSHLRNRKARPNTATSPVRPSPGVHTPSFEHGQAASNHSSPATFRMCPSSLEAGETATPAPCTAATDLPFLPDEAPPGYHLLESRDVHSRGDGRGRLPWTTAVDDWQAPTL